MVAKWYVALTSKLVSFIVTDVLLPVVRSAHHHTDMHFNQFPTSNAHSGCTSYSRQQRLLGSQRTHGTVSCWVALIETAYVLSQAKWVGRDEKKKTWQNTTSKCGSRKDSFMWPSRLLSSTCMHCEHHMHGSHFFAHIVMNIPRWNDSSLQLRRIAFFVTGSPGELCTAYTASLELLMTNAENKKTRSADINLVH